MELQDLHQEDFSLVVAVVVQSQDQEEQVELVAVELQDRLEPELLEQLTLEVAVAELEEDLLEVVILMLEMVDQE
jgi:endonuclease III